MLTPEIKAFVKKQVEENISREIITAQLTSNGWSPADVMEAFESVAEKPAPASQRVRTGGFFFLFSSVILFLAGLIILAWVLMR